MLLLDFKRMQTLAIVPFILVLVLVLVSVRVRASDSDSDSVATAAGSPLDPILKGLNLPVLPSLPTLASSVLNATVINGSQSMSTFIIHSLQPLTRGLISRERRQEPSPGLVPDSSSLPVADIGSLPSVPSQAMAGSVAVSGSSPVLAPIEGGAQPVGQIPKIGWKRMATPILITLLMPYNVGATAMAVGAMAPSAAAVVGSDLGSMVANPIISRLLDSTQPMSKVNAGLSLPLLGVNAVDAGLRGQGLNVIQ